MEFRCGDCNKKRDEKDMMFGCDECQDFTCRECHTYTEQFGVLCKRCYVALTKDKSRGTKQKGAKKLNRFSVRFLVGSKDESD